MEVAVWDTYVTRKNGKIMHFDIVVPAEMKDEKTIYGYGNTYLESKNEGGQAISASESRFCHTEPVRPQWAESIRSKGYHIYEMENCD